MKAKELINTANNNNRQCCDLSPHLSTTAIKPDVDLATVVSSTTTSSSCSTSFSVSSSGSSIGNSSTLSFSFRGLSLQHDTTTTKNLSIAGEAATRAPQNNRDGPRPRPQPLTADLDIFSSVAQSPARDGGSSSECNNDIPKGLMIRQVSLEPRTQFTPSLLSLSPDTTIGTYNRNSSLVQHKRSRHLSCDNLPTCDELVRQTQKRRRLAKRNRALTSTDFDSILGRLS